MGYASNKLRASVIIKRRKVCRACTQLHCKITSPVNYKRSREPSRSCVLTRTTSLRDSSKGIFYGNFLFPHIGGFFPRTEECVKKRSHSH